MTQDQVFVPPTRSELGLPPLDPAKEDLLGSAVSDEIKKEFWDALGDSPIGASFGVFTYFVSAYIVSKKPLLKDVSKQRRLAGGLRISC